MNSLASPTTQGILFLAAGLFILWETWAGWRQGLVRSLARFVAFVFSGFAGVLAGQATAAMASIFFPRGSLVAGLAVGALVTLLVLFLGLFLGPLFFRRGEEKDPGSARPIHNGLGALFGLLTALAIVWGGISLVRAMGALAEAGIAAQPMSKPPLAARALVGIKESLELGPAGEIAKAVDVVPTLV